MSELKQNKGRKVLYILLALMISFILFISAAGFIVIQPLGMLPGGLTILYLRTGTDLPFIVSPDGYLLKTKTPVSLLNRSLIIAKLLSIVKKRKILRLPYMRSLYLISTGGVEFTK